MKAMKWMVLVVTALVAPVVLLAQVATNTVQEVQVPAVATDILTGLANTWAGKSVTVAVWVVSLSQIIKQIASSMGADWGGRYGKWLVSGTTILTGLCTVVADGKIDSTDAVTAVVSVAGGLAAFWGYKLVFKQPSSTPPGV